MADFLALRETMAGIRLAQMMQDVEICGWQLYAKVIASEYWSQSLGWSWMYALRADSIVRLIRST